MLKAITRKRRAYTNNNSAKQFKNAHFKDFIDNFSAKVINHRLVELGYKGPTFTFHATIINYELVLKPDSNQIEKERFLIRWHPNNM
jgi:hypothetical protein